MASNFLANTTKLMSANTIAQIITIFAIPIITRFCTVETYGMFAVFLSLSLILTPVSTLGLHTAILIAEEEETISVLLLSLLCTLLTSSLLLFIICIGKDTVLSFIGTPSMTVNIYLLPFVMLLHGSYLSFTFIQIKHKEFGTTGFSKIIESISDRGTVLIAASSGFISLFVLIAGRIASGLTPLFYLFLKSGSLSLLDSIRKFNLTNLIFILRKYKKFVLYNTPSALLIDTRLYLPVIIISYFYSPVVAGLFAIGNRVVNVPMQVLGDALAKVYLQYAANTRNSTDKLRENTFYLFELLFSALLIPFCLLGVVGDELTAILLGENWHNAGVYIRILSCFAMSSFLARTFSALFNIFGKQATQFRFQLLNFFILIGILIAGGHNLTIINCLLFYSLTATFLNITVVLLLLTYVDIPIRKTSTIIIKHLIFAFPFTIALFLIKEFTYHPTPKLCYMFLIILLWVSILIMNNQTTKNKVKAVVNRISCLRQEEI